MTDVLIAGGTVIHHDATERADVLIRDGRVADIAPSLARPAGAHVIDADGCWVGPGFVDLHTHLREPGREEAETVASGARAAAVGGYSAVVAMPNTEPAIDSAMVAQFVLDRGRDALVEVAVAGAITVGRQGTHLAPIADMAALGVRLFTDDGTGVQDPLILRRALTYARPLGVTLAEHCEDEALAAGGVMNEGHVSSRLGLSGRPALAEELMVMRDIELVRLTGCPMHFLHLSTARSIDLVRKARADGLPVTCEVAPHHLFFDESVCEHYDALFKVHPPLRTRGDVDALQAALRQGDVDAVATDHAPHAPELKDLPFDDAPPGMLGLEHAASITRGVMGDDPIGFFRALSRGPAAIAHLRARDERPRHTSHGGDVAVGEDANLVVFDPADTYRVERHGLQSRAHNTPYDGLELTGRARALVVRGIPRLDQGQLT